MSIALLTCACGKKSNIALKTVKAEKGEISEMVTATGTVESVTQVDVGTQVTGIIDKLYVDYNSEVKKGQLIAEIEKTLLESELKSAEANVETAKITYEYNKLNFDRDKVLHDKELISDYEFQTSEMEYRSSRVAYEKAKADRVRAAKNLNYAEIYSPIDGIVISREVEVGQTVVSSMNVANLYTIADLDNMQVIGDVDEADIGQVKVGQSVKFTVDAYPDLIFEGRVSQVRLNPTVESNVVTYEVVVATSNPGHKLIPGLTANLTIYTMHEQDILIVPTSAFSFVPENHPEQPTPVVYKEMECVSLKENQKMLWTVQDNALLPVTVTTGVSNSLSTQILSGIAEGDTIAVGYSEMQMSETSSKSDQSPFAPKPPQRNKKR